MNWRVSGKTAFGVAKEVRVGLEAETGEKVVTSENARQLLAQQRKLKKDE